MLALAASRQHVLLVKPINLTKVNLHASSAQSAEAGPTSHRHAPRQVIPIAQFAYLQATLRQKAAVLASNAMARVSIMMSMVHLLAR